MKSRYKPIDENKLSKLYKLYANGEITKTEMSKKLGITVPTLNKRLKEYLAVDNAGATQTEEASVEQETGETIRVHDDTAENSLQIFSNEEFGSVRIVMINSEPWFVGKDVAKALGYTDLTHSVIDHVDKEDRINSKTQGQSNPEFGQRGTWLINESGLYSLILSSKLPTAKKFKRWVTSEVIPSIRKHGAYMTSQTLEKALLSPDFLIQLAEKLKDEQEKNRQLLVVNAALIKETNEWDNRSLVTHLIRKYGSRKYDNKFGFAWNEFYKNLNYKLHINLNARLAVQDNKKKKAFDMIKDSEWGSVVKVAVAMCENAGINTAEIIGAHGSIA